MEVIEKRRGGLWAPHYGEGDAKCWRKGDVMGGFAK